MNDCVFCKIIKKEITSSVIYEDDNVISFLSISPVTRGHALVVPKTHSKDLLDTDDSVLPAVIVKAKKIALAVVKATGAGGFNLSVNNGPVAGQEIFHLHFHIIPRYSNDGLKSWPHADVKPTTSEQMAEEIKKFIS